jgi:hypothetical protein
MQIERADRASFAAVMSSTCCADLGRFPAPSVAVSDGKNEASRQEVNADTDMIAQKEGKNAESRCK